MTSRSNINFAFIAFFILVVGCSSCRPNGIPRPDSPLCTVTSLEGECTDARGDFTEPHSNLMCTTLDGYLTLEKYVDDLEKEVLRLRRNCN
jgi:hypothetical protein